ncbi:predicted protein [Naegleria gruberi]|uniref:Predicted protein n=1 Tax=Naegleria gruberi TaxID=5762 RepID=D2UYF6_NAEGR|nr:uncharacterized protein NAEGRDRAFT_61454 [Naegleria gruberi]EFC50466.1 predicted protein [Naegleria gruberi]|eukprot:XP_002683210.1 predicted protein [Naegleria gruberi strain NEG-M]
MFVKAQHNKQNVSLIAGGHYFGGEENSIEKTTRLVKDLSKIEKVIALNEQVPIVCQFSIFSEGEGFEELFKSVREQISQFYSALDDENSYYGTNTLHDAFTTFKSSYSFYEYEGEIIDLLKKRFGISYRNENHTQKLIKLNKFIKKNMGRLSGKELRILIAKLDHEMNIEKDKKRFEITFNSINTIMDTVDECLFTILQMSQTLKYIQNVLLEIAQEIYQKLNIAFRSFVMPWMIFLSITARLYSITLENMKVVELIYNKFKKWCNCLPTREQVASYLMKEVSIIFLTKTNRMDFPSPFPESLIEFTKNNESSDLSQFLLNESIKKENQELVFSLVEQVKIQKKLSLENASNMSSAPSSTSKKNKQKKKK